jgi:hypothetical protein
MLHGIFISRIVEEFGFHGNITHTLLKDVPEEESSHNLLGGCRSRVNFNCLFIEECRLPGCGAV